MGGNARAIDASQNTIIWNGQPALARKISLNDWPRSELTKDLIELLNVLGFWNTVSPILFNGSSELLFDNSISDEEFIQYKPLIGDIDITVPKELKQKVWEYFSDKHGKAITNSITYVGSNKPTMSSVGEQMNCVFEHNGRLFQIDWEFVDFKNDKPTEWVKFSKSSNWNDIKLNVKGVFHKYLIRAIARQSAMIENVIVLTPSSTEEKPKIVKKYFNKRSINRYAFSIIYGLRDKIEVMPYKVDGYQAVKIKEIADSTFINEPREIFEALFGFAPTDYDMKRFRSFSGLLELIPQNKRLSIFDEFIELMWGISYTDAANARRIPPAASWRVQPNQLVQAQALDRDNWNDDRYVKYKALEQLNYDFDATVFYFIDGLYYGAGGEHYHNLRLPMKARNEN